MCEGFLLARPLSPLKHALAAVLQHLGGVLPPHLGYNPHRHLVTHDWLWSVGAHPLSWTSTGTAYSQLHIDALHRSYLLDALDSSVEMVNAGIAKLAAEKITEEGHKHLVNNKVCHVQLTCAWAVKASAAVVVLLFEFPVLLI